MGDTVGQCGPRGTMQPKYFIPSPETALLLVSPRAASPPELTVVAPQSSLSPRPQPCLDIILGFVVSKLVHLTDVKMHTIDTWIDSILLRQ